MTTVVRPFISYANRVTLNPEQDYLEGKMLLHNGTKTTFSITIDKLSIGCTDFTPEALNFVYEQYHKHFPKETQQLIVIQ